MTTIPTFELGKTKLTEEQFNKAVAEKSKGKGFAPGNYTLKITEAQYHENRETKSIYCPGDATWINVSVNLVGADERAKKHYLQVPTKSIFFAGKKGPSTFNFQKLTEFMAAMGVYMDFHNFAEVIGQYFSSPEALARLNGNDVNVDIGYRKPYAEFIAEGKYQFILDGKPYAEGGVTLEFPDRDAIKVFAAGLGKQVEFYPEILKFHPAPEKKQETKASNEGW